MFRDDEKNDTTINTNTNNSNNSKQDVVNGGTDQVDDHDGDPDPDDDDDSSSSPSWQSLMGQDLYMKVSCCCCFESRLYVVMIVSYHIDGTHAVLSLRCFVTLLLPSHRLCTCRIAKV